MIRLSSISEAPVEPVAAEADSYDRLRYAGVFVLLFLFGTETFLVSPLLPTIATSIHVSKAAAATSVTAYVLVYAFSAPFLGLLSDRFGRRRTLLAGAALFVLSNAAAALASGLLLLVAARAVAGLAAAAAGPAIWAHIAETVPDRVRGRALGFGMALFSCGQVIGVPLGGFLAGLAGWRSAFLALAIGTAATLPLLFRQVAARPPAAAPEPGTDPGSRPARTGAVRAIVAGWADPALRRALLVNLVFHTANLGAYTFLGVLLAQRFRLTVTELGLVGILVGAGSVVGSMAGGRLGDRARAAGRERPGLPLRWGVLLAAGIALTAESPWLVLALVGVAVWFLASGGFVIDQQLLTGSVAPELRATSNAWLTSTMYAGTGLGAWVVGSFTDVSTGVLTIGLAFGLLAAAGSLLTGRGLRRAEAAGPVPS